ncbi:MAG TPA: AMP-binding protein, partial [Paracoccaceae bacterium]|nr:AMP-binding protein [Paracoccaceae bacterium]
MAAADQGAEMRAIPAGWDKAHVTPESYKARYAQSLSDPDAFWGQEGQRLDWIKPYTKVKNATFEFGKVDIRWFEDGVLNVSVNCIDRHLATRGHQTAILWEPDDPKTPARHITYRELSDKVNRMANVLLSQGVMRGDRVVIYMPMIPEAAYAMLACTRIGAIHSIVFAGFSPDALANRINDSGAKLVITADHAPRGGKRTPLKSNTDAALLHCSDKVRCLVVKHTGDQIHWTEGRDVDVLALMETAAPDCPPRPMGAEDPLFILYTSGSTGKPKGVVHTTGGYLVYAAMTHELTFDYKEGDVFWCTADVGWVTGHSYIVYGPLANGATTLMF